MSSCKGSQRFYENPLPKDGEFVVVIVSRLDEMGVYGQLVEYGNVEGFIPTPELSVQRIRNIAQVTRLGKQEIVMVLRVDREKGYIDLSKRRVEPHLAAKALDKLTKSKTVDAILRSLLTIKKTELETLYKTIAWPLARKYNHAYDAFKIALKEPDLVLNELELEPEVQDLLMQNILRRLNPKLIKIRAEIIVKCDEACGVNGIKEALLEGERSSSGAEDITIECRVMATPVYTVETMVYDKERGITALNAAIDTIRESIEAIKGTFEIKEEPFVVSGDTGLEAEKDDVHSSSDYDDDDDGDDDDDDDE